MATQDITSSLTRPQLAGLLLGIWLLYVIQLGVRRLYFSPISHIPGPRLAAMTQYYEFYYDIILGGQYTFRIIEMHRDYGPVVRISPWEVHVGDHDFFPELYTGSGRPRDNALATVDHEHHKLRRSALNPFFSTQTVRKLQPIIEERVDALLSRLLDQSQRSKEPLDVMYPFSAFTNVEDETFGKEVTDNLLMGTHLGPMIKHMNWALTLVNALPESFSGRFVPGWGGFLKMKNDIKDQIAEIKKTENTEKWQLDINHPTIFHEMLTSKLLPPREKTVSRLAQDGQILVQGGTLTTSWTLSLAVFHLLNRPSTLRRLRDELFTAIPDRDAVVPLAELENLPYLRGVVKESLRLGFGTSSRLARICPEETLVYYDKARGSTLRIPPGTAVGMSTYKTQTDPSIYFDPFGFHPERWVEEGERLERYLTVFCGGTRVCLGMALAQAELYLMLAKLFRRWGGGGIVDGSGEGDLRRGDVGVLKIFKTTVRDCEMAADYFIPIPYKGSKGIRIVFDTLDSAAA
ncbi:N-acetyltryptophan 6-hydroxylase ivoC [Colletotrichum spaethianum]|uniref:N-acetyltryptophan 6-hydroxylase ivoC n=1 Tax=Colletotrichum spaethianum TaxID=700344 RepID=A0AA37NZR6_9PEZI|nr:N-acetyltryptophan 6-hydroxylase ivoC [Colletotrichum spaethianum]GKT42503.1 N-acetyltryptophan 6-hydroxylase ivoC [Colletotrichum spaethianum]